MTAEAERLLAKQENATPGTIWVGWQSGVKLRLKLIDRNPFDRCLVVWPDGKATQVNWSWLNHNFKAVGLSG